MALLAESTMHNRKLYGNGDNNDKYYVHAFGNTYDVTDDIGNAGVQLNPTTADVTFQLTYKNDSQGNFNDANDATLTIPTVKGQLCDKIFTYMYKLFHPKAGQVMTDEDKKNTVFTFVHTQGADNHIMHIAENCQITNHPNETIQNSTGNNANDNAWPVHSGDLTYSPNMDFSDLNLDNNK